MTADSLSSPNERLALLDELAGKGIQGVEDVALAVRDRWAYTHLASYRLALGLSQGEVSDLVSILLREESTRGNGPLDRGVLGKYEMWPVAPYARRPPVEVLIVLAELYGTSPRRLVGPARWDLLPAIDRLAITIYEAFSVIPTNPDVATVLRRIAQRREAAIRSTRTAVTWQ